MTRGRMILASAGLFAAAFIAGSLLRVDQSAAARRVRARIASVRGPKFPAGDTLALADTMRARCGALTGRPKMDCYGAQLEGLRVQRGTRFAMGALDRLTTIDREVAYSGHEYAHMIGIASYKDGLDVTSAFASCTEILQSGCYHGVIETYLLSVPHIGREEVNAVCRAWSGPDGDRWLRFQCVHGMGHGLELALRHDLPKALAGCDLLAEEWDRKSCYGGAFMENIVFAVDPSMAQMVMGDAPADHHASMPGMAEGPAYKMIDRSDPYYPCDALPGTYQEDCWMMQGAVMLQIYNGDFAKTFAACDGAPEPWRATCYQGTGTEISGAVMMDHHDAILYCQRGSARYRPWCYEGVVKNFVDVTARSEDAVAFCREVPERGGQLLCYQSVGEEIAALRNTPEQRRPLCEAVTGDPAGRDACLFGAQVIPAPPRGIPAVD